MTGKSTEPTFNEALGAALRSTCARWKEDPNIIQVEQTNTLSSGRGKHADILIQDSATPPIIIETSNDARDAEADAKSRLGDRTKFAKLSIETAIAVHIPKQYRDLNLKESQERLVAKCDLRYALYQKEGGVLRRWPDSGWIRGNVSDLGRFARISVQRAESAAAIAEKLYENIVAAADRLEAHVPKNALKSIQGRLNQRTAVTALHTTMILWLNALLTQQRLHVQQVSGVPPVGDPKKAVTPRDQADIWREVLGTNWRSIFEPAIRILEDIYPTARKQTKEALDLLVECVEAVETSRLGEHISIGAELFPMLSSDRKEAAAFYTKATTAELLATLTVRQEDLTARAWRDPGLFKNNRIADLACGTGTLLRAGYLQIAVMHEIYGGTSETTKTLHKNAMEGGVIGTDISGIAAHLTTSALTAIGPGDKYEYTQIGWVEVCGELGTIGSLEYFQAEELMDNYHSLGGRSEGKSETSGSVVVKDRWLRWIIMNPPYTRTRNDQRAFDVQGASEDERRLSQKRWGKMTPKHLTSKQAGMASSYLALAEQKLLLGGRMGFVLPLTAAFADSWKNTRRMMERQFTNIVAITTEAQPKTKDSAMSADTGMEEMLLVAERRRKETLTQSQEGSPAPITCITLAAPPRNVGESREMARAILGAIDKTSKVGEASRIPIGNEAIGHVACFEAGGEGGTWSLLGVKNPYVALAADYLTRGILLTPEGKEHKILPAMVTFEDLFSVGETHDLIGHIRGYDPRGAFEFVPIRNGVGTVGQNHSLWATNSASQRQIEILPTHEGTPNPRTAKGKGRDIQRANLFYSRFMRWTSQCPLAATTRHPAMGGNQWASLKHENKKIEKAFALWANSIYGLLVHWTRGSRTQKGRSIIQIGAIRRIPCPNFSMFDEKKLDEAVAEYERIKRKALLPACQSHVDKTRKEINDAVRKMLDWPYEAQNLSTGITTAWCHEPSVHGYNKKAIKILG